MNKMVREAKDAYVQNTLEENTGDRCTRRTTPGLNLMTF